MSNTIRLTSTRGHVRWVKSLSYDGDEIADRTGEAWIAQDVDWPDRDDYPRWHLPYEDRIRLRERNRLRAPGEPPSPFPGLQWMGGFVVELDGTPREPRNGMTDEQILAIVEVGAVAYSDVTAHRYDDEGRMIHYWHADWCHD